MARLTWAAAALAALALAASSAPAAVEDFSGNWENSGHDPSGITHVLISPAGGTTVSVRVFGDCHPIECNWGQVDGKGYTTGPKSEAVDTIVAVINAGFARRQMIFRKLSPDRMAFEVFTDYEDGVGKNDFAASGTLERTSWAGPLGQNWERPGALATGWGGGARSGTSPAPKEACEPFDPREVKAVAAGAAWKITAGNRLLAEAGGDEQTALRAQDVLRHYRFDRQCRVGRAVYWKRADAFPRGRMGGADCLLFNTVTTHLSPVARHWTIVDGVQWIASFEGESDAEALLALIRYHHLDAECFVGGRQNPVLTYWLAF
ncbi:MAG: hypothetical protein KGJ78_05900 [Alphaproteobacteria bacterium]|nr:hypothetical protein [Alphaproteobacteria bacterium]